MSIFIPDNYECRWSYKATQIAIKKVKDYFQTALIGRLNLYRVSAPLFVFPESGLNDNLNGVERPVSFGIKEQSDKKAEIVHSLAKWKRYALDKYGFKVGEGLYTDMSAIRRDELTDNIHSIYVDQWDWEKIIEKSDRTETKLKKTVREIYEALKATERFIRHEYEEIIPILPEEITFVTTQELEDKYPELSAREREYIAAKEYGAIFLMGIGGELKSGEKHDGRAPDYDDWGLNGDIIVYYPVTDIALELSSMGIRVDEESLKKQLEISGCIDREQLPFQKAILNKELPYTMGGGIGQSRICMFFLRKAHIGEVQASIWPEADVKYAEERGIKLL